MFGSQVLELVIGLVFIFFVFSLVTSAITEGISSIFAMRANTLKKGILRLLDQNQDAKKENSDNDFNLAEEIFEHSMVKNLGRPRRVFNRKGLPSYLPTNRFATALLDIIFNLDEEHVENRANLTSQEFIELTRKIKNPVIEQTLSIIVAEVADDIQAGVIDSAEWLIATRKKVEIWFDEMMERVTGWYKRSAQIIIFFVALLIAVAMNIDTIMVTNILWKSPAIRAALASSASETVTSINSTQEDSGGEAITPPTEESPSESTGQDQNVNLAELQDLEIIGWSPAGSEDPRAAPTGFWDWGFKIIGLIITAFALTLGAPFWFDVLSKLVNLRGSGKIPAEKESDSGSSDSTEETTVSKDDMEANRKINNLRSQLDMLQENVSDQFINIIIDKLSDEERLVSLFNFTYRDLTPEEIQESKEILPDNFDYQKVKIFEGNDLPNFLDDIGRFIKDMPKRELTSRNAITLGNCCFMGKKVDTSLVQDMSWLIHELTHVWQYQSSGWEYLWKAWEAQKELKEDAYYYGGESGLSRQWSRGTRFRDFNPEQQGQIVQDYYVRLKKNEELKKSDKVELDTSIFECYINEMI